MKGPSETWILIMSQTCWWRFVSSGSILLAS